MKWFCTMGRDHPDGCYNLNDLERIYINYDTVCFKFKTFEIKDVLYLKSDAINKRYDKDFLKCDGSFNFYDMDEIIAHFISTCPQTIIGHNDLLNIYIETLDEKYKHWKEFVTFVPEE